MAVGWFVGRVVPVGDEVVDGVVWVGRGEEEGSEETEGDELAGVEVTVLVGLGEDVGLGVWEPEGEGEKGAGVGNVDPGEMLIAVAEFWMATSTVKVLDCESQFCDNDGDEEVVDRPFW